jgi:hypothetical protein
MVTYRKINSLDILEVIQTIEHISGINLHRENLLFKEDAVQQRESCDVIRLTIMDGDRGYVLIDAIKENSHFGEILKAENTDEGKVFSGLIFSDQPPSGACVEIEFRLIIHEKYHESEYLLTSDDLLYCGFRPVRKWDDNLRRFRMVYEREGYDCQILISPFPNEIGDTTPEKQIEQDLSSVEFLKIHHTGDWQVYAGSFDTHLATFHFRNELFDLMLILGLNSR